MRFVSQQRGWTWIFQQTSQSQEATLFLQLLSVVAETSGSKAGKKVYWLYRYWGKLKRRIALRIKYTWSLLISLYTTLMTTNTNQNPLISVLINHLLFIVGAVIESYRNFTGTNHRYSSWDDKCFLLRGLATMLSKLNM